jgi:uncharacterized membrane protein YqjE
MLKAEPPTSAELREASTSDIVREALDDARELIRLEVEIAKQEMKREIGQAKRAAVAFGIALALGLVGLSVLAFALVVALGGSVVDALVIAAILLVIAAVAGIAGYAMIPRTPLVAVRDRLTNEVHQLRERVA